MFTTDRVAASPFHLVTAPSGAQPAVAVPQTRRRAFWRSTSIHDTPEDNMPVLLTVREACTALRVSRWSLYELIRSGKLATIKVGRRRLVPMEALRALIDDLRSEGNF